MCQSFPNLKTYDKFSSGNVCHFMMSNYFNKSIGHQKYIPSLNATWGAFSKNLLTNASPTGAAPTRTVSTGSKCLWVTSLLFARNKTTGGTKCKIVG